MVARRAFTHGADFSARITAVGFDWSAAAENIATGYPTPLAVVNGTRVSGGITLAIDSSSPLSAVGNAALVQTSIGDFLVAHTAQNAFVALSATCTHQTCTITGFGNQNYVCPCHGSTFDVNGRVVGGPAPAPLHQYPTQFTGGILTITA